MAEHRPAHLIPRLFETPSLGYGPGPFVRDALAGLTVGVVALPLAMAFAIAAGATPDRGLFTAIVAGFLISALGGSRYQIGGPTGAFVVIIFNVIQRHGYDGLVLCTILAGLLLVVLGFCRLGALIKYIPHPVTTGFTAGIGVLIFSSQMKDFFGLRVDATPPELLDKWAFYLRNADKIDYPTLGIALAALAAILAVRRFVPRVPAPVVGVALASLLAMALGAGTDTIGSRFGGIPDSLPAFAWPQFSLDQVRDLLPDALAIALLAGIESLLSCMVADGMTGDRHNSDMELIAQGAANIASAAFGGIPATGAIARTATNIKSGAFSPVAGMVHAAALLCFVLLLSGLASHIALASLAAVLVVVAWDMSEAHKFMRLFRAPKSDVAVMLLTFGVTIVVDLTVAVLLGVVLASLLFMRRMSETTGILAVDDGDEGPGFYSAGDGNGDIQTYEIDGPFFFGVADRFRTAMNAMQRQPKAFILRLGKVPVVDSTGLFALETFVRQNRGRDTVVLLSGVKPAVLERMRRMGTLDVIGEENVCADYETALGRALGRAGGPAAG
ncbi:MAG: SulP family inorganic anion transporter [Thermodesulfobacteriota bacterium]